MNQIIRLLGITVVWLIFWGCAHKPAPQPHLTCPDLLQSSLSIAGDEEIGKILDEARDDSQINCWELLVKKCLDKKREIPHPHVTYAVKGFNKRKEEPYFNKAVLRYFLDMIRPGQGRVQYRKDIDRPFLKAYCQYAISQASSPQNSILFQAEDICQRLDRYMYKHIFTMVNDDSSN